jgi:hypothetical protein
MVSMCRSSLLVALLLCFCVGAQAESIIFLGAGGNISYAGGSSKLTGSNIVMDSVFGDGTPFHDGIDYFANATLTFETGELSETTASGELIFSPGGFFNIIGSISDIGLTNQTLLSGSFLAASFDPTFQKASLMLGTGSDYKHEQLVSWFFGSATPTFEFSGTIMTPQVSVGSSGFSTYALTADVTNVAAVPEPSSLTELAVMVIATGMTLVLAGVCRRRKNITSATQAQRT